MKKLHSIHFQHIKPFLISCFWFLTGVSLGLFLLISFTFIIFQTWYANVVYPGVMVNGVVMSGKTEEQVRNYFTEKNAKLPETMFVFSSGEHIATISAKKINFGYDASLLAKQAYSIGRSRDLVSNISLVFQAYLNGVNLPPSYSYSDDTFQQILRPVSEKVYVPPINAVFTFQNNRVTTFEPSTDGQIVDIDSIKKTIASKTMHVMLANKPQTIVLPLPIKILEPRVTTEKANDLGIKELVGTGTSLFQGSIQNRIHNVALAATKINGILIAPNETFSFNKALGDISVFTGFKQAYVIQNGRTVLGDGGGVCQVSTTLFRAILDAGLPIVERHAHAYRVSYYEQDSPPGLDATIFVPGVDLRFKNDTGHHILIQSSIDPSVQRLTFMLYGTRDDRQVEVTKSVVTSQTPAPEPLYQDDSTLPKGEVKQVDFSAAGATVTFSRTVTKNGKVTISEKFDSRYRPWQAVYLRGTKE